jgi:hypothetical protein
MARLLFILKKRDITADEKSQAYSAYGVSSGLKNSASFVVDMLNDSGIKSYIVEVADNNAIDREVSLHKPTHVIIEAYWVVPEKFDVLQRLYPRVKWIVRNHSEIPFLANEGNAIDWTLKYIEYKNVYVAPNSERTYKDTQSIVKTKLGKRAADKVIYLPNYYRVAEQKTKKYNVKDTINVGCFGAIRPFKNHLVQAMAAIQYAQKHNLKLRFHINVARIENSGNNVLKNLRALFAHLSNDYELIEHGWLDHNQFLDLVDQMDIGLQVSFTESFNIVSADFVSRGVPVIVSREIDWIPRHFWANPTDVNDIISTMESVLFGYNLMKKSTIAMISLNAHNNKAKSCWKCNFE